MKHSFDNGLTLLVRENHAAPLVTADIWFRCGAADEPTTLSGVSHFLEHMIFKGSERLGVGEFDRRIENMGGDLNAATSQDFTHFYLTVPNRYFAAAFEDLADVVAHASLDPDELEKERQVILEEIRRKQDNPTGFLFERVFEETFRRGSYKRPVLGNPETVGALTRDQMAAYHRRHYGPGDMTIVVVGDIRADEVVAEAQRRLAGPATVRASAAETFPGIEPNEYQWGLRREYKMDVREAYLMLVFPGPGLGDGGTNPDLFHLEMANHILGGGRASRLWQVVREQKRLVSSIAIYDLSMRRESLTVVMATLEPQNIDVARDAIFEEIGRFAHKGPTAPEMQRARKAITNAYLFHTETNAGQSSTLGYYYSLTGDESFADRYLRAIATAGRTGVREAAGHYLTPEQSNLFLVVPEAPASAVPGAGSADRTPSAVP